MNSLIPLQWQNHYHITIGQEPNLAISTHKINQHKHLTQYSILLYLTINKELSLTNQYTISAPLLGTNYTYPNKAPPRDSHTYQQNHSGRSTKSFTTLSSITHKIQQ